MRVLRSRKPNVERMKRKRDLDGLREALRYRETVVDEEGEWDVGLDVRVAAAEAMSEFNGPAVAADLAEALDDPQPAARLASIDALSKLGLVVAVNDLARCVAARDEGADEVSDRALDLLAGWQVEGPAELLVETLLEPGAPPLDDRHREALTRLIEADPRSADAARLLVDGIVAVLQEAPDEQAEPRAERILGWLAPLAPDTVLNALVDGKASPGAMRVAGQLGDDRAVDPILRELRSADPAMRRSAAMAAGQLNHTRTVIGLLTATQDPQQQVRDAASAALDRMGTAAVIAAMATFVAPESLGPVEEVAAETPSLPKTPDQIAAGAPDAAGVRDGSGAPEGPRPPDGSTAPNGARPPGLRRRRGGVVDRLLGRLE
ncbi:MAG TPA: HEAT repeat domain-containing protein [Thermoleophilaceae bacterium]